MTSDTPDSARAERPHQDLPPPQPAAAWRPPTKRPGWHLIVPHIEHAQTVAGWFRSATEATTWASRPEHPFPTDAVTSWWQGADVQPLLLVDPAGVPAAYGELCDDEEEDEVELARLIVDPDRRRQGVGRRLVDQLLARARRSRRAACFIRVVPDNHAALTLYRSAGFRDSTPTSRTSGTTSSRSTTSCSNTPTAARSTTAEPPPTCRRTPAPNLGARQRRTPPGRNARRIGEPHAVVPKMVGFGAS
jgi:ribosomal protein S18 acetylase RimI-like enzyme